jgi:lipid A ethanolaminephosphotransferase
MFARIRLARLPVPAFATRFSAPGILLTAGWLMVADNGRFWALVTGQPAGDGLAGRAFLASVFVFGIGLVSLVLTLLTYGRAARYVLAALLVVSAAAAWFMNRYGILLDQGMIENLFATDRAEALELVGVGLAGHVVLYGLLPAAVVWRMLPRRQSLWDLVLEKSALAAASLLIMAVAVGPFFKDYASMVRNHREIRYLLTPVNYLGSLYSWAADLSARPEGVEPVGEDASRGAHWATVHRPVVAVLVVGETARADSFSLNGYGRPTNPRLARLDLVYFENVSACGTATAVSLPCMFSDLPRANYSKAAARGREGLLDVVEHAGIRTVWLDNNAGCKGVCGRADTWTTAGLDIDGLCEDGECFDDILLRQLDDALAQAREDLLIVLHMNGSHGPAYFRRYPDAFRRFTPDCRSDELTDCSREEIVNSYDNTIYYTDWFLAQVIARLDRPSGHFDTALLYVSDHGESLGEYGLYLHGTPYLLAPGGQTHVPMMVWLSSAYRRDFGVETSCLRERRRAPLSHDNVFHSVLGMLDISTSAHNAELDLFGACAAPLPDAVPAPHSALTTATASR